MDGLDGNGDAEPFAQMFELLLVHLLLLVGVVAAFAGLAHAVAFDGLGQDHRRRSLMLEGPLVSVVYLHGVMAATGQSGELLVGHIGDQFPQLGVFAEELLADIGAALHLVVLEFAVDAFVHSADQQAGLVLFEQPVPTRAPDHLDHIPARAAVNAFKFLDDAAVAAHGSV